VEQIVIEYNDLLASQLKGQRQASGSSDACFFLFLCIYEQTE